MVATNPRHTDADIDNMIHNIGVAARVVLGGMSMDEAELRGVEEVDAQKFDIAGRGTADEAA